MTRPMTNTERAFLAARRTLIATTKPTATAHKVGLQSIKTMEDRAREFGFASWAEWEAVPTPQGPSRMAAWRAANGITEEMSAEVRAAVKL